jgi:hypothetical protein
MLWREKPPGERQGQRFSGAGALEVFKQNGGE